MNAWNAIVRRAKIGKARIKARTYYLRGVSSMSEEQELPTAARLIHDYSDGKDKLQLNDDIDWRAGDELVRREDAESFARKKFADGRKHGEKRQRQRIQKLIDNRIEFYENLDREFNDVEYGRFKELKKLRQEIANVKKKTMGEKSDG